MSHLEKKKFEVMFLEDAILFLESLTPKATEKIIYNINKACFINDNNLFKKINPVIWEFRTIHNKTYYRLFAFWDKSPTQTLVIVTHGIIKKKSKIDQNEIDNSKRLMELYLNNKTQIN